MLEASTSGFGQHKHKSINVEVNLLAEWASTRSSARRKIRTTLLLLGAVIVLSATTLPTLSNGKAAAEKRSANAAASFAKLDGELSTLTREQKEAVPKLDGEAMRTSLRRRARQFLGQTVLVLNSAPAGMAFESLSIDVISGEQTIRCKADAERDSVVRTFVTRAGEGPRGISTQIANSRASDKLAEDGVAFELVKKVEVGP